MIGDFSRRGIVLSTSLSDRSGKIVEGMFMRGDAGTGRISGPASLSLQFKAF
jgi:hypothetical protein